MDDLFTVPKSPRHTATDVANKHKECLADLIALCRRWVNAGEGDALLFTPHYSSPSLSFENLKKTPLGSLPVTFWDYFAEVLQSRIPKKLELIGEIIELLGWGESDVTALCGTRGRIDVETLLHALCQIDSHLYSGK